MEAAIVPAWLIPTDYLLQCQPLILELNPVRAAIGDRPRRLPLEAAYRHQRALAKLRALVFAPCSLPPTTGSPQRSAKLAVSRAVQESYLQET